MKRTLMMPKGEGTRELIEGHPVSDIVKIIKGDLRTVTFKTQDGETHTYQNEEGVLLYDRDEVRDRPWFVLAYESGNRVVD